MPLSTIDNTGLSQSQILSAINIPTGSVVQVVQATTTSGPSTTSTTFVTSSISASITPQFSTSKILVSFMFPGYSAASGTEAFYTIYRSGTELSGSGGGFSTIYGGSSSVAAMCNILYLDNPATTSSTTYTLYFKSSNGGTVYINSDAGLFSMILQEIR